MSLSKKPASQSAESSEATDEETDEEKDEATELSAWILSMWKKAFKKTLENKRREAAGKLNRLTNFINSLGQRRAYSNTR
jgi:hypothetical protein